MASRWVAVLLVGLLLVLQAQLWWGRGSVPQVQRMREQLAERDTANHQARLRNDRLAAEVRDLQQGQTMVEELARLELGMVKPHEIFVQITPARP